MEPNNCTVLKRPDQPQPEEQLNSWKEIACYLKREVRTVRRWETYESLPVHRHIHNVRGSVYAFRSEVDSWLTNRRTQPKASSIVVAVVPFENLSGKRQQKSLGRGLSAELATELVRLTSMNLRIIDCSSPTQSKNSLESIDKISERVGATHVLGGTIRSDQERVQITVYLLRVNDRTHVWAESYGRSGTDDATTEVEVARLVAQSVVAKLLPVERPMLPAVVVDSTDVQKAYIEGRSCWNKRTAEGLVRAIGCFDQAIRQDPSYAPAYAGLADSYLQLGFYGILPVLPAMKKAKAAAIKAVELDDSSGEAHASLADVMKYFDWNLVGAEKEYQRAIHLDPSYPTAHHWYGDYLAMMGRFGEAHEKGQRALDLDPISPIINTWVGMQFYLGDLHDEAIEQLRKTRQMHPNYALAHWALGLVYDQQCKYEDAIEAKERAVSLSGESPWIIAALGCSYAVSGKSDQALKILERLTGPAHRTCAISYEIATIYAGLHDHNASLQWLQMALDEHSAWAPFIAVEPRLRCLHADERFQRLAGRFGFVAA